MHRDAPQGTTTSSTHAAAQAQVPSAEREPRGPLVDGSSAARLALAAVGAVILLNALEQLRELLVVLLLAGFGAIALDPPVRYLERRGASRSLATGVVATATAMVAAVGAWLVLDPLVAELVELARSLPTYLEQFSRSSFVERLDSLLPGSSPGGALADRASDYVPELVGNTAIWLVSIATSAVLLLALTILMLVSAPSLLAGLLKTAPRLAAKAPWRVLTSAYHDVSRYAGGQIAIALIAGAAAYVAMRLIGVPHALPLAGLIAALAVIPVVGAVAGGGAAVLVAAADEWWKGAAVLAYLLVYQQVEGNVLGPVILGRALSVSALVVIVSLAAGYALLGIPGMIIAVPAAATIQIVLAEYRRLQAEEHPERVERAERRIEEIDAGRE